MTFAIITSEKEMTPRMRLKTNLDQGRKQGQMAGSYIADLASSKKAIWLCPSHAGKFNKNRYEYVRRPGMPIVNGFCDGCREHHPECRLFMHHSLVPRSQ